MNKLNRKINEPLNFSVPDLLNKKYEIFSSQIRLSVMLILHSYRKVKIAELQKAFNISSGKLEHHLNSLETEGLLRKKVDLFLKRVLTTIEITDKGEDLLLDYLEKMRHILREMKE